MTIDWTNKQEVIDFIARCEETGKIYNGELGRIKKSLNQFLLDAKKTYSFNTNQAGLHTFTDKPTKKRNWWEPRCTVVYNWDALQGDCLINEILTEDGKRFHYRVQWGFGSLKWKEENTKFFDTLDLALAFSYDYINKNKVNELKLYYFYPKKVQALCKHDPSNAKNIPITIGRIEEVITSYPQLISSVDGARLYINELQDIYTIYQKIDLDRYTDENEKISDQDESPQKVWELCYGKRPPTEDPAYRLAQLRRWAEEDKATCGYCERGIEIDHNKNNKDKIYDHGFTIRRGYREACCGGSKLLPWEKSPEAKILLVSDLEQGLKRAKIQLKEAQESTEAEIRSRAYIYESEIRYLEKKLIEEELKVKEWKLSKTPLEQFPDTFKQRGEKVLERETNEN